MWKGQWEQLLCHWRGLLFPLEGLGMGENVRLKEHNAYLPPPTLASPRQAATFALEERKVSIEGLDENHKQKVVSCDLGYIYSD